MIQEKNNNKAGLLALLTFQIM